MYNEIYKHNLELERITFGHNHKEPIELGRYMLYFNHNIDPNGDIRYQFTRLSLIQLIHRELSRRKIRNESISKAVIQAFKFRFLL